MYAADLIQLTKVSEQDFEKIVYQWLAEGDYTPDDIIENIITKKNLCYLPVYFFKRIYDGTCSASIGYPRSEEYQVWNSEKKRYEYRSRTVIDWRPHYQPVNGRLSISGLGCDTKNKEILSSISKQINNIRFSNFDFIRFEESILSKKEVIDFQYTSYETWKINIEESAKEIIFNKAVSELPGSNKKDIRINLNKNEDEQKPLSIYVPFWFFLYEYAGKEYFVFNDAGSGNNIGGTKPEDKRRKNRVLTINLLYWLGWPAVSWGITYSISLLYKEIYERSIDPLFAILIFLTSMITMFIFKRKKIKEIKSGSNTARQLFLSRKLREIDSKQ